MTLMTERGYEVPTRDYYGEPISLEDQERFRQALDEGNLGLVGAIWKGGVGPCIDDFALWVKLYITFCSG